jgi:hypothetical protein
MIRTVDDLVRIKVKLARDIDREKPCHDNLAVIHPGKAQRAGEFRCSVCGAHRGWLSQASRNLILETVRRFGAPRDPIILRQQEEKTMAFERKNLTGAIFVNDYKTEEKHPDSTGSALIDGVEYNISCWRREAKNGKKYLALSFKKKDDDAAQPKRSLREDLNDAIPI